MVKMYIYFFILVILKCAFVNSQSSGIMQLPADQLEVALDLYYQIYSTNTTDPCSDKTMFTCKPINDGSNSGLYTITQLGLNKKNVTAEIIKNPNFSVFVNATYFLIGEGIILESSLFSNLPNFYSRAAINIYNETTAIPESIKLPINLKQVTFYYISVAIPLSFFEGSIETFNIKDVEEGFSLPTSFSNNINLKSFSTSLRYNTPFPSNAGSTLKNITSLRLTFYNNMNLSGYKNYSLPTFEPFNQLTTLSLIFNSFGSENVQYWDVEPTILNIKSLDSLNFNGKGLKMNKSIGYTDISNLSPRISIHINKACELVNECTSKPCIKLPVKSYVTFSDCSFNVSNIDFTNVFYMKIRNNNMEQELPNSNSNIQFSNTKLDFNNNTFIGSIPDEYCQFRKSNYTVLGYNQLSYVPTCFTCIGANQTMTRDFFPNKFIDFNISSTPSSCPTFSFSNYNATIKTIGNKFKINGTDFGWDVSLISGDSESKVSITIPNKEIEITIPRGEGSNKSLVAKFGLLNYIFNYSYEIPQIEYYDYINSTFYIFGSGFSFINTNFVLVNGAIYNGTIANENIINGNAISFSETDPTNSMSLGNKFNVSVNVGGQISNTINFYLFKSIYLSIDNLKLNVKGGSETTLIGEFGSNNTKIVTVYINNIKCVVQSINSTALTLASYPSVPTPGFYEISVNIGGLLHVNEIEYIQPTPSNSNILSTSFSLILITILFIYLF